MTSSNSSSYSLINELNTTKKDGKILVRVSRLWEVLNYKDNDSLLSIDMVLIDEEGDYVHATIKGDYAEDFRSKLKEGDIYIIKNFAIDSNKSRYRVVSDSKIMIRFFWNTYIKAIKGENTKIVHHRFDFLPYNYMEQRRLKPTVLTDVFGVLVNETVQSNVTSIELQDKSKNRIKLKLWGQYSTMYNKQKRELGDQCKQFIVVVTSILVKGDTKVAMTLSNSASTKIYFNLNNIPEINELKELLSKQNEDIVVGTLKTESSDDIVNNKKDILTIINHCKEPYEKNLICYCLAEVEEVMSELRWYNPSCPDCNRKLKQGKNDFYCNECKKSVEKPIIVYHLELLVKDLTGTMILTMFNDEAKRMTKQEASTLYDAHIEQERNDEDYDRLPSLLRNVFEGKIFLFKIKVDEFNHRNWSKQTFSIMKVLEANTLEVDKTTTRAQEKRPIEHIISDDEGSDSSSRPLKFKRLKKKTTSLTIRDVTDD